MEGNTIVDGRGEEVETISATIPVKTVSETNRRESHWGARKRRAATQRDASSMVVGAAIRLRGKTKEIRDAKKIAVILVRHSPGRLDDDNLRGALKAVRDGVADALGIDDGDERIGWRYGQVEGKEYAVMVTVEWKGGTE